MLLKPIRFCVSQGIKAKYDDLEFALYIKLTLELIQEYPFDMFVFEMKDKEFMQIKLSGYNLNTNKLDETTVIYTVKSLLIKKFWFKIDDYGDEYIGTFFFPEEY